MREGTKLMLAARWQIEIEGIFIYEQESNRVCDDQFSVSIMQRCSLNMEFVLNTFEF